MEFFKYTPFANEVIKMYTKEIPSAVVFGSGAVCYCISIFERFFFRQVQFDAVFN